MQHLRHRSLNEASYTSGAIVYWMSRDQRVNDNWALLTAQGLARKHSVPLIVVFNLVPEYVGATWRHYSFMLRGLREVEDNLRALHIGFCVTSGDPSEAIARFCEEQGIGGVVCDFAADRVGRRWREQLAARTQIPLLEVDAHNIVPCWVASPKQEFAARTFRPKIQGHLAQYLTDIPSLQQHVPESTGLKATDWEAIEAMLTIDRTVEPVEWCVPSEQAAAEALQDFLDNRLTGYAVRRNDPTVQGQSELSPYLHFGQLSAQRVALAVQAANAGDDGATYLEELIVRRELADNYCYYCPEYDQVAGFPAWAQKTLSEHAADVREHLYEDAVLESGTTADPLWNAAQLEMVKRGKMHGYMRMYWAKKILEWSESPEDALRRAIYLNDRYSLDGRDPNGWTGIAWSIGGVHDRPWFNRPIFGLIRYMSKGGAEKKFDVAAYCAYVASLK